MALTQWNPLSEFVSLRDAVDQLFNQSMVRPNGTLGRTGPAYDQYETEEGLTFRFAVPGIRPEDVEITVNQGILTVKAVYPQPAADEKGWVWHTRGLPQTGDFQFGYRLPMAVDADHATASFEHGILTLSLPKAETAKPKRIQIGTPAEA